MLYTLQGPPPTFLLFCISLDSFKPAGSCLECVNCAAWVMQKLLLVELSLLLVLSRGSSTTDQCKAPSSSFLVGVFSKLHGMFEGMNRHLSCPALPGLWSPPHGF